MQTIRLLIEYDGTDFHGWQVQSAVRTVQGDLQDALRRMTGQELKIQGASRTDAGVHAEGQVAQVTLETSIPVHRIAKGLTALTEPDVVVIESTRAEPTFSARRDARGKIYRYSIWNGRAPSAIRRRTSWHVRGHLDLDAMRCGARHLVGEHDFAAFRAASCDQPTTVRDMRRVEVHGTPGGAVEVIVEGTAFLQHMVRIMVGTLVEVGLGKLEPDEVGRIRDGLDRRLAGRTAPPQGLCLVRVHY